MLAEGPATSGELRALLDRVGRGDAAAFRTVVEIAGPRLYGILLRSTGNEVAAAALLQSTFEEVWRLAPCYDRQSGPPFSWILALCRAGVLDHAQKHGVAQGAGASSADPEPDDELLIQAWLGKLRMGSSHADERLRFAQALRARARGQQEDGAS